MKVNLSSLLGLEGARRQSRRCASFQSGATACTPFGCAAIARLRYDHQPRRALRRLTGFDFVVVDHEADGAQQYERLVAHIACPPGEELNIARQLQQSVLIHGRRGGFITFMDSRKGVETLAMATAEDIKGLFEDSAVSPYRAGFVSAERRQIEQQLRSGGLRGVVSTSALECVDICIMLGICQQLDYLGNNGQGHMSSFKVRQACTLGRKPNVGGSSMLYCGFLGPVRNGGCSQPNMVIGTASINVSPDGVNAEYGSVCISIWSMTPTWNTSSSTAQWSVPILALRGR